MSKNGHPLAPKSGVICFRQWKRGSFAIFATLKRSVRIAVLAIAYVLSLSPLKAQVDTVEILREQDYQLDEVEVRAERTPLALSEAARMVTIISKKDIEAAGAGSISELLEYLNGIDQRQRGQGGIQSDISINGGSYEQVMVLLNGINITDPQTGHFHMNIPVPVSAIERIEIIRGSAARVLGPNAYSGAINIVTKSDDHPSLVVNTQLGQYKFRKADVYAGSQIGNVRLGASSQYTSTSGYRENTDSKDGSVFLSGSYHKSDQIISWQAGASQKSFGANSFYSPSFPDQYEENASLLSSLSWENKGKLNWKQDVYIRYHEDEFHLFRFDSPSWYSGPNNHLSRILGSQHNFWFDSPLGRTSLGVDLRNEKLWSNVLGDSLMTPERRMSERIGSLNYGAYRSHSSLFAEHRWGSNRFHISGGLLAHIFRGQARGLHYYPGLDVSYRLFPDLKIYSSISKSLRLPSFTELYYTSPTHLGNSGLLPESAWDYRFGAKLHKSNLQLNTSVNARWSENSIDWVRNSSDEPWVSRNSTEFFTLVMDAGLIINEIKFGNMDKGIRMKLSYNYIYQEKDESSLDSKYVMDYLKHKLSWQSSISFLRMGLISLNIQWADRAGEYTDWDEDGNGFQRQYDPFLLADLKLRWKMNRSSFNISINNLFNTDYADFGHIWQPGRWIMFGVGYEI